MRSSERRDGTLKKKEADGRSKSMAEPGVVVGVDDNGDMYLKRATLERALEQIVTESQDHTFLSMFFITLRTFTSPLILLTMLSRSHKDVQQIRIRICIVIKHWITYHWEDFDDHLLPATIDFLRNLVIPVISSSGNIILQLIEKKKLGNEPKPSEKPWPAGLTQELWNPKTMALMSPIEIARQLTMIEQELFFKMRTQEFFGQGWLKTDKDVVAPNIVAAMKWFNKISYWWATEILTQSNTQARAAYVEFLVKLAYEFFTLQNYSSCLQVLSALQSTPIRRLTDIWEAIIPKAKKTFDHLATSLAPTQGWQAQRELLANKSPPSIPYIGMHLTDLTFLDESAPTMEKDIINFEKLRKMGAVIQDIQMLQQARHSFEILDFIRQYFFSVEPLDEPQRYEKSYALQPRGTRNNTLSESQKNVPETSSGSNTNVAKQGLTNDADALKSALLDGLHPASDLTFRVQDVYHSFQKVTSQLLRAKGSSFANFTDQHKTVHDTYVITDQNLLNVEFFRVTKVHMELLEFGSTSYVVLTRMVCCRVDVLHLKKLVSFYATHTGHSSVRGLVMYAVLETEDLLEFSRDLDVILIQIAPRGMPVKAIVPTAPDTASPRQRQPSNPVPMASIPTTPSKGSTSSFLSPSKELSFSPPSSTSSLASASAPSLPISSLPMPVPSSHISLAASAPGSIARTVSPSHVSSTPSSSVSSTSSQQPGRMSPAGRSMTTTSPSSTPPSNSPSPLTLSQKFIPDNNFTAPVKTWTQFFSVANYPRDLVESYASLLDEHMVELEQMGDLTAQVLRDMGLRVGPIMRIQRSVVVYLDQKKHFDKRS